MPKSKNYRCALLTGDAGLRQVLRDVLEGGGGTGFELGLELQAPIDAGSAAQRISDEETAVVLVDLGIDPLEGIALLRALSEDLPDRTFLAAGPQLQPDMLLQVIRAGASEYLPRPLSEEDLVDALDRLFRRLTAGAPDAKEHRRTGRAVGVVAAKGGSGVTTTATNLAVLVHEISGEPTVILDLDRDFGTVGLHMGLWPRYSYMDVVQNFHRMDDRLLDSYITKHESGVHLLSSPADLEDSVALGAEALSTLIQLLRRRYAHVVVDLGSRPGADSLEAVPYLDRILLVTHAELPTLRNTKKLLGLLRRAFPSENGDHVRVVMNRSEEDSLIAAADVREALGVEVDWRLTRDDEAVPASVNRGVPVVLNGRSPFSRDLRRLVAAELLPEADVDGRGVRRLFRNVFGRKTSSAGGRS